MRALSRVKRRYLSVVVVVIAAGAAFALSTAGGRSSSPSPPGDFSTIPAAKLALAGIVLGAPRGATPSAASGQAAAAAASREYGGRSILEYHYANCVDNQRPGMKRGQDCWAVSLDPTGIISNPPPGQPVQVATYVLVLIDPTNDKLIEGAEGR